MKAIFVALLPLTLATLSSAQNCREVVHDGYGRITQTIDRHTSAGGSVQATTRDASGRITGSETTHGTMTSNRRDASGRVMGSSTGSGGCPTGTRVSAIPNGLQR